MGAARPLCVTVGEWKAQRKDAHSWFSCLDALYALVHGNDFVNCFVFRAV